MKSEYEVLGCNDDQQFCSCCGKQGLSKVVWLHNLETDEISHYGVVCAKKLTGSATTNKAVAKFDAQKLADEYAFEASAWEKQPCNMSWNEQNLAVGKILHESGRIFTTSNAKHSINAYLKSISL